MGRQLDLKTHCLLCLKETDVKLGGTVPRRDAKVVYERAGAVGVQGVAVCCSDCLEYLRGGNWPPAVYAKLSELSKEERAEQVEVTA